MSKATLDSQRNRDNYTFHPQRLFSLDWTEEQGSCYLLALDDRDLSALRKMVQVFPKYHWVWGIASPRSSWSTETWDLWNEISSFVEELEGKLVAGCDLADFVANSDRIATALESLDSKVAERYEWQEFIDDLEDAFGITSAAYLLAQGIYGLMPRLALKIDFSQVAHSIFEYYTWKAPILVFLKTIAGAQIAQASAQVGFSIIQTIQSTILGWKEILIGDKSVWTDLISPLWSWFIPDSEGGTGGEDPDNDPALRVQVNLFTDELVSKLEEIRTMLETRLVAETVAGNTRIGDLIAIQNAIENVLGGDYEPE